MVSSTSGYGARITELPTIEDPGLLIQLLAWGTNYSLVGGYNISFGDFYDGDSRVLSMRTQ